jgi:hypothetical protein
LQLKEIEMKDSRLTKNTAEKRLTASVMSFHFSPPALPTWAKKDQQSMHVHRSRTTTSDKLKPAAKRKNKGGNTESYSNL